MIHEKEYFPQFRESDHTGLIGANGYFEYFQDAVTAYMHALGKGNDTLPETYGICWFLQNTGSTSRGGQTTTPPLSWLPGWKIPAPQSVSTRLSPSPKAVIFWPKGGWRAACAT